MDRNSITRITNQINADSLSLVELMRVLPFEGVARVRVDLVRKETCYFSKDDDFVTVYMSMLRGLRFRRTPAFAEAVQAVERSRFDRISYGDFVLRIAKSGYASFAVFVAQNVICFEARTGESLSLPVILKP